MARRQGPEEKYYPQVWRFLRRCISPLMTPREGNTFASRNGLSNRFSHMNQPQSLRHRQTIKKGDNRDEMSRTGPQAIRIERSALRAGKRSTIGFREILEATEFGMPPRIHRQIWKGGHISARNINGRYMPGVGSLTPQPYNRLEQTPG